LQAEERYSRIEERFLDQELRLDNLLRFFANSSAGVSRTEFHGYAQALSRRTRALAWAPVVAGSERAAFEQRARDEGVETFVIREPDEAGHLRQAGERDEYIPVLYVQGQPSPLGLDLLSHPL